MIGIGMLTALIALVALWRCDGCRRAGQARPGPRSKPEPRVGHGRPGRCCWAVVALPFLPLAANTFGWLFTEMGRQPWIVFGQMKTAAGVSANSAGEVLASVIVLTLLYGGLAVVEVGLHAQIRQGRAAATEDPRPADSGEQAPLALVY